MGRGISCWGIYKFLSSATNDFQSENTLGYPGTLVFGVKHGELRVGITSQRCFSAFLNMISMWVFQIILLQDHFGDSLKFFATKGVQAVVWFYCGGCLVTYISVEWSADPMYLPRFVFGFVLIRLHLSSYLRVICKDYTDGFTWQDSGKVITV